LSLPTGWIERTLGEVCEVNPVLGLALDDSSDVSFVPMAAVEEETGRLDPSQVKSFRDLRGKSYRPFREGDVLVAKITPSMENGKGAVASHLRGGVGFGSTEFHILRPRKGVEPWYILRFILQPRFRQEAARAMTGTAGQLRVPARFLRDARIPLPPPEEQRRILEAIEEQFSRLDAAKESLRRASIGIRSFDSSALESVIGEGWPVRPLHDLLVEPLRNGHSAKAAPPGHEGIRTLTLTAVTARDFSESNTKITTASPDRVKDLWLEPGDILIERSNTTELVGLAALYQGPSGWAIFPDLMIRTRVGGDVLPEFVDLVLRTRSVRRYFRSRAQGISGSMPKISQATIEELEVPVPPRAEQVRIVDRADAQFSVSHALREALSRATRRTTTLRSVILREAFGGRLVSQHPSGEAPSDPLERLEA
jgi:type I restriction enzyme, S subunit